jgi:hypothetical protein
MCYTGICFAKRATYEIDLLDPIIQLVSVTQIFRLRERDWLFFCFSVDHNLFLVSIKDTGVLAIECFCVSWPTQTVLLTTVKK